MKKSYEDLLRTGQLKKVSGCGYDQAARLLKRSSRDLRTAELLITQDKAAAMDLIYKGIFHAANALLRLQGYRPGIRKQHIGVVEALVRTLGKRADSLLLFFDRLRRKRNKFEYQAIFTMSSQELQDSLQRSREIILEIKNYINKNYSDLDLNREK